MNTASIHKKFFTRRAKKNIFVAVMLLIPIVHFIIFWGIVNFNSILYAFERLNPVTKERYFTTDNFNMISVLFKSGELRKAFGNTILTWAFLTVFLLPWSFLLTYFLYKKIPLKGFWRTMLFVPTLLPAVAMTSIFRYLIYPQAPIGKFIGFFMEQTPAFLENGDYARWTVIVYIFLTNFGGQFVLLSGAMARVPKEVTESAYLDGAGMRVEMLRIVLPLCWPTLSMLLLLNTASLFTASGPVLLLTEGYYDTKTISYWIFEQTMWGNNYYVAAALGMSCTALLFPIVIFVRWALSKVYANVEF